jgi:electron transfer flavoprotein beta subunit
MRVLLIAAGIFDPKWPLPPFAADALPPRAEDKLALSPFEEAALELALRMRDADREHVTISAVLCGAVTEKLARAIGSYNIADVARLDIDETRSWDVQCVVDALASFLRAGADFDLILLGREVGDCDDGLFAPLLAARLRRPFFGLAQDVECMGGALTFIRERNNCEERFALDRPVIVSVTNDRRNRLRRPLMKNMQAAKRAAYPIMPCDGSSSDSVRLTTAIARASSRHKIECNRLAGAPQAQIRQLAVKLRSEARL